MNNVSFLKKIKHFLFFRKIVKKNRDFLEKNLNIRLDDAYRLYTVVNVPEELIGDAFSLKKSDIDTISQNYIIEYNKLVAGALNNMGLMELFSSYETKKVDKYSYLIVIGFSLFKSDKFYNNLYFRFIPLIVASTILFLIYFFLNR